MNDHVTELVDHYLDGELNPEETGLIDAHLAQCQACSRFYAQHRHLSDLIKAQPSAATKKTDRQFADEIIWRIKQQPQKDPKNIPSPDLSWIGIPLLLVFGLAFIQTVWVESSLVQFVPQVGEVLGPNRYLLPFSFALPSVVDQLIGYLLSFDLWRWDWVSAVLLSASLGLIYVSWLAGWWIKNQKQAKA